MLALGAENLSAGVAFIDPQPLRAMRTGELEIAHDIRTFHTGSIVFRSKGCKVFAVSSSPGAIAVKRQLRCEHAEQMPQFVLNFIGTGNRLRHFLAQKFPIALAESVDPRFHG